MHNRQLNLQTELYNFLDKTGAPSVGAGVIDSTGATTLEVVGTCNRADTRTASSSHQWHIGSCTKSLTAVLYSLLVEQQITRWTSTLEELFPDCADSMHPSWRERTAEQLFFCRAGMPANPTNAIMSQAWKDDRALSEQRTNLTQHIFSQPAAAAGKFVYSNLSYIVIGAAIDRLCKKPYEDALNSNLLSPLGITSVGYGPPTDIQGHTALLRLPWIHLFKGKSAAPTESTSDNPRVFSSAGTLHLSLSDWAKFLAVFLNKNDQTCVSQSAVNAVLNAPTGYIMAKGIARTGLPDVEFGMQGSNTAWAASVLINTERNKIAFVICNDGRSSMLKATSQFALQILRDNTSKR